MVLGSLAPPAGGGASAAFTTLVWSFPPSPLMSSFHRVRWYRQRDAGDKPNPPSETGSEPGLVFVGVQMKMLHGSEQTSLQMNVKGIF